MKLTLEILNKLQREQLMKDLASNGMPKDTNWNRISRGKIRAMRTETGSCFIWTVNPDKKTDSVVREYKRGMVHNFEGAFITHFYDEHLKKMIETRLKARYTGMREDFKRVSAIFDYAETLKSEMLFWV